MVQLIFKINIRGLNKSINYTVDDFICINIHACSLILCQQINYYIKSITTYNIYTHTFIHSSIHIYILIQLSIIMGHSISGSFILALWKMIKLVLSVFKGSLMAFNHVESLYNSWL